MYSSKSNYVRKVYKTKLENHGQPNIMDECLQFPLIPMIIYTLSEKFTEQKFSLLYTSFGHASSLQHILSEIISA